ncbi:hypothetical protein CN445_30215 [Bacillus cereus]|nr:hypothetical protein CN445_30215 [Bacillus cereus]PFN64881.1 hypothetical protein COJ62_28075 [Bacillus cereus]
MIYGRIFIRTFYIDKEGFFLRNLDFLPLENIEKDKLGFKEKAEEIANFINGFSPKLPYSLSVNGSWGAGKSTMLNFIESKLDEGKCKVIRFNPWMISESDELIKNLFEEIYYAMGEGDFKKAKDTFFKYARKIIPSATKALTFAGTYMYGMAPAAATTASTVAGEATQVVSDVLFDEEPLSKKKKDLNKMLDETLREDGQKIVIMIDELDRLFPEEVITVFQMIKSNLDLPGLFFVVAMDEEAVFDALLKKGITKPEYYLQKIFQRKYFINTKYQIITLTKNFITTHLNLDKKSHKSLHDAILAYFHLEHSKFIYAPDKPASFYDPSLGEDLRKYDSTEDKIIKDSYYRISDLLASEINLHNPRAFLQFTETLIERWDDFYTYVFKEQKDIEHYVYISFLVFISHYAYPNYTEMRYLNSLDEKSMPLFIQEIARHIAHLTPAFTQPDKYIFLDRALEASISYLNKFPDFR